MGRTAMNIASEWLLNESNKTGFRSEILEKVILLMQLLELFMSDPFLQERLVLKGGTALNLFHFSLPRLSIDIDLNYIGTIDRQAMLEERIKIESLLMAMCQRAGFMVKRTPTEHAGGKMLLQYNSKFNQTAKLQIDLNYMLRIPLWSCVNLDSCLVGNYQVKNIPTLDIHELAAGKLAALFSRHASRDLFDTYQLFTNQKNILDKKKLRFAFVVYGAMQKKDWRKISIDDVSFTEKEVKNELIPVLQKGFFDDAKSINDWGVKTTEECRIAIKNWLLPFSENEFEFLNRFNEDGDIVPELIIDNNELIQKVKTHPNLLWKSSHVKKHKERVA